jgi:predicted nucleic acid-binding protein
VIYLDTSALVKLVWAEPETPAVRQLVADHAEARLVSSELLVVETRRAVLHADPAAMPLADLLLTRVDRVAMTRAMVETASRLPDPHLRSLEAIHLATALTLRHELRAFVTYDKRLAGVARAHDLPVAMPTP